MTVEAPADRLTGLRLESLIPEICGASLTPLSNSLYWLSLPACSNRFLIGTQQVAWLYFTTVSNQSSAFVSLQLDNTVGFQQDGTEARNFAPQSGRLVIIGNDPLLEAFIATNRQPSLNLYGKPGPSYVVETATDVRGPWTTNQVTTLTDLWTPLTVPANQPQQFYRAKRQ